MLEIRFSKSFILPTPTSFFQILNEKELFQLRQEVVELAHDDFEPLELADSSSSDEDDSSEELAVLEMNEVGAPEMMNLQEVAPGGREIFQEKIFQ